MKKIFFFFSAVTLAFTSVAQTIPNAGMENWRTNTSGSAPVVPIQAPISWYGFDSTIISDGQLFAMDTSFVAQLFQDTSIYNSGHTSAKLITLTQGAFGNVGGIMSNAQIGIDIPAIIGGADPLTAIIYSGGTATTSRIMSVSAYVKYLPGIDPVTLMMGGIDTGSLIVQAITNNWGADSVIGTAFLPILPSSSFTQITANVTYVDTFSTTDRVRIIFNSGILGGNSLDSSTLYVDDVTMTGIPQTSHVGVKNVAAAENIVNVFPNPASGVLYINGPQQAGFSIRLLSVSGQVVATQALTGNDVVDIHALAAGSYLYAIIDKGGKTIQHGKVSVVK